MHVCTAYFSGNSLVNNGSSPVSKFSRDMGPTLMHVCTAYFRGSSLVNNGSSPPTVREQRQCHESGEVETYILCMPRGTYTMKITMMEQLHCYIGVLCFSNNGCDSVRTSFTLQNKHREVMYL